MAQNEIQIKANVKDAMASFGKLIKFTKDAFKSKIVLDVDDKRMRDALKFQKDVIISTQKEIKRLSVLMSETFDDKATKRLSNSIKGLKKDLVDASSHLSDLQQGAGGGGMRAGGGGFLGGGGLLAKAGGIGLGIYAAKQIAGMAMAAVTPAIQASVSRLTLRGLGVGGNDLSRIQRGGLSRGYGPQESFEQAINLQRATGSTGSLGSVQNLARGTGMDANGIIGLQGGFRQGGMSGGQSIKLIKDIYIDAVARGFDQSRAFDLLSSISQYTASMAQTGGVSVENVREIVNSLMGSSSFFSQNQGRAMNTMKGVESAFTGGGPAAALAFRALRGLPQFKNLSSVGMIHQLGLGLTQEGGAGGAGFNAFLGQVGGLAGKKNLKPGGGMDQMTQDQRDTMSVMLRQLTGTSQSLADKTVESFLSPGQPDLQKNIKKTTQDLATRTLDVQESVDMNIQKTLAFIEDIKLNIADKIAPAAKDTAEATKHMDELLTPFLTILNGLLKVSNPLGAMAGAGITPSLGMGKRFEDYYNGKVVQARGTNGAWVRSTAGSGLTADTAAALARAQGLVPGVRVTSTMRDAATNAAVGGAPHSAHMRGAAFDLGIKDLSAQQQQTLLSGLNGPGVSASIHTRGTAPHIHVQTYQDLVEHVNKSTKSIIDAMSKISKQSDDLVGKMAVQPSKVTNLSGHKKNKSGHQ